MKNRKDNNQDKSLYLCWLSGASSRHDVRMDFPFLGIKRNIKFSGSFGVRIVVN